MSTAVDRARMLRRRHQRERQAVVFGSLVAGLGVVGLFAVAVYSDVLPAAFLDRGFSTAAATDDGTVLQPAPCPPVGTLPVTYNAVTVNVLNSSGRAGLASQTAGELATRGFVVGETGNATKSTTAQEEIHFGEAGLAAAYTLASSFDSPVLVLDTRADASVDLVLGTTYTALLDAATVVIDPSTPLVGVKGCVSLDQARTNAVPGPTPSPSATTDANITEPENTVPDTGVAPAPEATTG